MPQAKKLSKTSTNSSTLVESRRYVNGFEYTGGIATLSHIATAEGRWLATTNKYEFSLKDHLGNTRLTLSDTDGNGVLAAAEVTQSNMYYAFGLEFAAGGGTNKYKYNSKEQMSDFGLGLYDCGARMYDAATGRWNGVDALAEKYAAWSAYNYVLGNPVRFVDPDGRSVEDNIYITATGEIIGVEITQAQSHTVFMVTPTNNPMGATNNTDDLTVRQIANYPFAGTGADRVSYETVANAAFKFDYDGQRPLRNEITAPERITITGLSRGEQNARPQLNTTAVLPNNPNNAPIANGVGVNRQTPTDLADWKLPNNNIARVNTQTPIANNTAGNGVNYAVLAPNTLAVGNNPNANTPNAVGILLPNQTTTRTNGTSQPVIIPVSNANGNLLPPDPQKFRERH
jgi:RHS repeat-associated protein